VQFGYLQSRNELADREQRDQVSEVLCMDFHIRIKLDIAGVLWILFLLGGILNTLARC